MKSIDKTLVLFEFKDEIDSFLLQRSIGELRDTNTYILALLPEAQAHLKRMDIRFFNTYSFFNRRGHEQALLQSDRIYRFCQSFLTIKDDLGITEGYKISLLFYMRCYVHYILWLIEIIDNACSRWNINKILFCQRDNSHMTIPRLADNEGYVTDVGKIIASKYGIRYELFRGKIQKHKFAIKKITKFFITLAKLTAFTFNIYAMRRRWGKDKILVATSKNYNLDKVVKQFKEQFPHIHAVYLSEKNTLSLKRLFVTHDEDGYVSLPPYSSRKRRIRFFKALTEKVCKLENSPDAGIVFEYKGVKFKTLVIKKIKKDIIPTICNIYGQSVYLEKFLKTFQPSIVISQMSRDINYNLGELTRLYNIPSLLISHGSHVPMANEYEKIECGEHGLGLMNTHYKYVAIQSPWAKRYLQQIPTDSKEIVTGPLLFAQTDREKKLILKQKIIPKYLDKKILIHAGTPKTRFARRFYVYETTDEYINNINSLIQNVKKIQNAYLIVRFRPNPEMSINNFKELLLPSDCYGIHMEGPFSDYLAIADLLISYSSTTIEEAILNKVPVLLYDPHGKYCHVKDAQPLNPFLEPRIDSCYYVSTEEHIYWGLRWIIENHLEKTDVPKSIWERHALQGTEVINLVSYFEKLFSAERNLQPLLLNIS